MSGRDLTPQKLDSVVRSLTTSLLALSLVAAVIYLAVTSNGVQLTPLQIALVAWAGIVVGFYFGGHVAQNTAALEEARLIKATDASEAPAIRSEAATQATERKT